MWLTLRENLLPKGEQSLLAKQVVDGEEKGKRMKRRRRGDLIEYGFGKVYDEDVE